MPRLVEENVLGRLLINNLDKNSTINGVENDFNRDVQKIKIVLLWSSYDRSDSVFKANDPAPTRILECNPDPEKYEFHVESIDKHTAISTVQKFIEEKKSASWATRIPRTDHERFVHMISNTNISWNSRIAVIQSSKRGSVGKCDSWGLCKRLMGRKSGQPQQGCFVKRDFSYRNPDSNRVFKVPELKVYCCKTGDRCNKVSRHGPLSCEPLSEPWPPAQA